MSVKKSEELATEATERSSTGRWLEQIGREALALRESLTDDEIEALVDRAIQESREQPAADE